MIGSIGAALLLGYAPGALLFRLPIGARDRRAALPADERVFWGVMLSLAVTLGAGLALAVASRYSFDRLLLIDGAVVVALLVAGRSGLRYAGTAARPSWWAIVPLAIVVFGAWRFFPPSEYIIGGKDPGVYVNEGVQIAQRGAIVVHDPVVAAVPPQDRPLFFPVSLDPDHYSLRFMGFYVQNPDTGTVVGQFEHLFPVSIAMGYGMNGLSGARQAVAVWAILGLLAVYFAGARLAGRPAALAGVALLAIHVIETWFARYPNAEVVMETLLFAALLAFARAHQDGDRFFAPVSAVLFGLLLFNRYDAALAIAAVLGVAVLLWLFDRPAAPRLGFFVPLAAVCLLAVPYFFGPMRAYTSLPVLYLTHLPAGPTIAALIAGLAGLAGLGWLSRRHTPRARTLVPLIVVLAVFALAAYAAYFRQPGGKLADYDAYALRTFIAYYLLQPGFLAALLGFALLVRRSFWRDPALITVWVAYSCFLFYKLHIVPEHFWAARRFFAVILPGAMLFIGAAAMWTLRGPRRGLFLVRPVIGVLFLVVLGQQYLRASEPLNRGGGYVEYAGIIPYLERLSARFTDRDLILVEARDAGSDLHTLATPLADIYARNVLVLATVKPDKLMLEAFLQDASQKYAHVYFLGTGGTDLLSRHIIATPVAGESVRVPEYDSPLDGSYPLGPRRKDFDYGVYRLQIGTLTPGPFALDVGAKDDLNVVRFYAKESADGRSMRWTERRSFVEVPGLSGAERHVVLVLSDGGRPAAAPPAQVSVLFDDVPLGTIDVKGGFQPYTLTLPAELAERAAARDNPAQITLLSTVWNPHTLLGVPDTRDLGVMVNRVEVQ